MTKTYTWRVPLLLCWDLNAAFFRTALLMPVMCQLLVYLCQVLVQLFTFQTLKIRVPAEAQDQYGDLYSWGRAEFDVLVDPPPLQAAFLKIFSWQGSKFNLDCNTICVCTGMCLGLVQFSSIEILRIHPWSAWLPVQGASQGGWTTGEGQPICSSSVAGSLLFASSNFILSDSQIMNGLLRVSDSVQGLLTNLCQDSSLDIVLRLQILEVGFYFESDAQFLACRVSRWSNYEVLAGSRILQLRIITKKGDTERFGLFVDVCSLVYSMRKFPNVLPNKFLARSNC